MSARARPTLRNFLRSMFDPRAWLHMPRLVHYYNYSHVTPRRRAAIGPRLGMAPNVSLRNGERITIGAGCNIGARSTIWAGDTSGRVTIGDRALFGPEVFITASNYGAARGVHFKDQPRLERDVVIGDGVWLGARVIVLPGVEIGDGCVVGAGSIVTKSLPANSIAVGAPARVVGER